MTEHWTHQFELGVRAERIVQMSGRSYEEARKLTPADWKKWRGCGHRTAVEIYEVLNPETPEQRVPRTGLLSARFQRVAQLLSALSREFDAIASDMCN